MSYVLRWVLHCDVCSHEWLSAINPTHCARCKSRRWNKDAKDVENADAKS